MVIVIMRMVNVINEDGQCQNEDDQCHNEDGQCHSEDEDNIRLDEPFSSAHF